MKNSFFLISMLALIAVGASDQKASAQNARYKFAPTVWRKEQFNAPCDYATKVYSKPVRMPASPDFLGFDALNNAPKSNIQQTQSSHCMSTDLEVTPVAKLPYNSEFGHPELLGDRLKIAKLFPPPVSLPHPELSLQQNSGHTSPQRNLRHGGSPKSNKTLTVHANWKNPRQKRVELVAPQIASYDQGYIPGGNILTTSDSEVGANTSVSGQILPQKCY